MDQAANADSAPAAVDPLLIEAFDALDGLGLTWAVLRGGDALADGVAGDDVDLLAAVPDLELLDRGLAEVGWLRLPAPGRGPHRFWFRYDSAHDRWLKLDLVDSIDLGDWHQYRLDVAAQVLARRTRTGQLWRLHPVDEQWLRALHDVHDKGRDGVTTDLVADGPVPVAFDSLAGVGASDLLLQGTAGGFPTEALRAGAVVSGRHRVARRLHSGRRLPMGRGLVVQLLGPDGAGKSTLAAALVADLPVDAVSVYMGLWRETAFERRVRRVPGATTAVRVARAARMCSRARMQVARGRLVVLDRSPSDALLGDADRSAGGRVLAWCALRWAPRPFLVIVLDAPGEVLYARKPEHPVEVLERRRQDYLRQHPDALVLDATASQDEVRRAALQGVWERLVRTIGG